MKNWMGRMICVAVPILLGIGTLAMSSGDVIAQDTPPIRIIPDELVPNLDLTCHRVEGDVRPPVDDLTIRHLNPVLQEMGFEKEYVKLGEMEQLCVPVAKNEYYPPSPADEYIRWIDLACYKAESEMSQQADLQLEHLNPVLQKMGLPPEEVFMLELDQLCVPVMKNGAEPPDSVRWLVEHVDVACYDIESMSGVEQFDLHLNHLNPVLQEMGLEWQDIVAYRPNQLCVPVMKEDQMPPEEALEIIQWIDFEKYAVAPLSNTRPIKLMLQHLNPLFQNSREFYVEMLENEELAVPVEKKTKPVGHPRVEYLDLTCHRVEGEVRPPVDELTIRHLNPVLQEMGFEREHVKLSEMEQLCVPVAKNEYYPPAPTDEYARWIDLACYHAESEMSQQADLQLRHLNPVLQKMGLPPEEVLMLELEQLCVPVMKNGAEPPNSVRWLVEHVDVACYDIESMSGFEQFRLHLDHLNPVLQKMGLKWQDIVAYRPDQLCVPVMKEDQMPPEEALELIQWFDFEKYAVDPLSNTPPIKLMLQHLNPLFQNSKEFYVEMLENEELAVPVDKKAKPVGDPRVEFLDLTCHRVEGEVRPPVEALTIRHLNPVLQEMGFDREFVKLSEMEQLCVPVAKNDHYPPAPTDEYARWIDLACYHADSEMSQQADLQLRHLNPVLQEMGLPPEEVLMLELEQLCVPVMKNGAEPPNSVRWLVEHVDVACYDIKSTSGFEQFRLHLNHLNPVLQQMGLEWQDIIAYRPDQLCVPVMKEDQMPPEKVLELIQWFDFEKYAVDPLSSTPPIKLMLQHLNPLFRDGDEFVVEMWENQELAVPVEKKAKPDDDPKFEYLDLTCHRVEGEVRPPVNALTIRHLNPVLQEMGFEKEYIRLSEMEQLCVPVAKNQYYPPSPTDEYVRWIDLACYHAESAMSQQADLQLRHLNPVLKRMGLPPEEVFMLDLDQLCVPVMKNGAEPPNSVRWLVEHVDVACYDIESMGGFEQFRLHLNHLNPVLQQMGLDWQDIVAYRPNQLCVPVMKEDQVPPPEALELIQWIDFEKYAVDPLSSTPPIKLMLQHLNPLFRDGNEFVVEMWENEELAVPVEKNR
jgi:hypothetical protein